MKQTTNEIEYLTIGEQVERLVEIVSTDELFHAPGSLPLVVNGKRINITVKILEDVSENKPREIT